MRFSLTSEQLLLRDALRELLREQCPPNAVRTVFEAEGPATIPGLWAKLVELGVIGALAPEAVGGVGLDLIDLMVLIEESGRAAVPEPLIDTAAVAVPLLAALSEDPRAARALARVLAGDARVAVALRAGARVVPAELLILERASEIHLVDSAQARLTSARSVDRTRHLQRVDFEASAETSVARGLRAQQLLAAAWDRAALSTAAQLIGLGARMLALTTAHVQTREQFGRPIGSFQAVKHQLVNAHVAVEFAQPLVYRAAHSIAREDPGATLHVSMAKAMASEAALLAARTALQLHGAIGYSYEYDLQLFMKRTWALAAAYGDALSHRTRIAEATLAAPGEEHA
ncbi:MAG TPA: acyl-CoA dehydrogenase [Polyangiales bacterium]|nr:acyl-CoA dehydrogenase [Polyangiales bacterium]